MEKESPLPSLGGNRSTEFHTSQDGITREELFTLCKRFDVPPALTKIAIQKYDNHDGAFMYDDFVKHVGPIIVPNVGVANSFHVESDFGPRWDTVACNFVEDAKHRLPIGGARGNPPVPIRGHLPHYPWMRKMDQITPWLTDAMGHPPKGGTWPPPEETWQKGTHCVQSLFAENSPRPETAEGPLEARCPTLARYELSLARSSKSPRKMRINAATAHYETPRVHFEGGVARTVPKRHPYRHSLAQAPCTEKGSAWFEAKGAPVPTPVKWAGFNSEKPGMYLYETSDSHEHFTAHCAREIPSFKRHLSRDRHMQKPLKAKVEQHLRDIGQLKDDTTSRK